MFRCPLWPSSPLFININPSERPMTGDPIGVPQPGPSGLHCPQVLVSHYLFYALVMSFCCNYLCLLNVGYYLFFIHGLPFTAQTEQSAPKRPRLDDPPPLAGPLDTSWVCILLLFYHSVPFLCSNYYYPCCCRKFFFSFYALLLLGVSLIIAGRSPVSRGFGRLSATFWGGRASWLRHAFFL